MMEYTFNKAERFSTESYEVEHEIYKGFYIDVVTDNKKGVREAFLYHENYGTKKLIVGMDDSANNDDDFRNAVQYELTEDAISDYIAEVCC